MLALAVSVLLGFQGDWLVDAQRSRIRTDVIGSAVFTDGHEVTGAYGCQIVGGRVMIIGGDPQFYLPAGEDEVSGVHMLFSEPVAQETPMQLFYVVPGGSISEDASIRTVISAGVTEWLVPVPLAQYDYFRFDIEAGVALEGIFGVYETQTEVPYSADPTRTVLFGVCAFFVLGLFGVLWLAGGRRNGLREASASRKAWGTILLCNLFLALTVVFFQPFSAMLESVSGYPPEGVWGMQLLWAALIGLGLSGLMLLLPAGAGIVAAGVSLSLGAAFLAQCLLFNPGRVLRMDTNWPTEVENAYLWAAIIIITVATLIYYRRGNSRMMQTVMCVVAWVLIVVQLGWVTVMWSLGPGKGFQTVTRDYLPESRRVSVYAGADSFGEWMELSLQRGAPILLKDSFRK